MEGKDEKKEETAEQKEAEKEKDDKARAQVGVSDRGLTADIVAHKIKAISSREPSSVVDDTPRIYTLHK